LQKRNVNAKADTPRCKKPSCSRADTAGEWSQRGYMIEACVEQRPSLKKKEKKRKENYANTVTVKS
jgi:hypothetical protein